MNNNLLSVVVITYNQPKYIYRLLDSIFLQTYPLIELIIADDGTIDFDDSTLSQYINDNKRENIINVQILHEDVNAGTVKNINRGLKAVKGNFVKIVAGDDFFPNEFVFSKQVKYLNDNPDFLIVSGQISECYEDGTPANTRMAAKTNELQSKVYGMKKEKRLKYCFKRNIIPYTTQAMCFRTIFFSKYGYYDEKYILIEDTPMAKRLVEGDIQIGLIGECVIVHRINSGVSSIDDLFKARSIRYYQDNKMFFYNSYKEELNLWWRLDYYNHYKISCYRIAMTKDDKKASRCIHTIRYLPSLILYSFLNLDIFPQKIQSFIRSFK